MTILGQILYQPPEPPSKHRPGVDRKLDRICLKAMAKQPEDRYATMADFSSALDRYLGPDEKTPRPIPGGTPVPEPRKSALIRSVGLRAVSTVCTLALLLGYVLYHSLSPGRTQDHPTKLKAADKASAAAGEPEKAVVKSEPPPPPPAAPQEQPPSPRPSLPAEHAAAVSAAPPGAARTGSGEPARGLSKAAGGPEKALVKAKPSPPPAARTGATAVPSSFVACSACGCRLRRAASCCPARIARTGQEFHQRDRDEARPHPGGDVPDGLARRGRQGR